MVESVAVPEAVPEAVAVVVCRYRRHHRRRRNDGDDGASKCNPEVLLLSGVPHQEPQTNLSQLRTPKAAYDLKTPTKTSVTERT